MKLRWINRVQKTPFFRYRVCSVLWGTDPRDPGHKNKITVGIGWRLFGWGRAYGEWILTVAGVRLHYRGESRGVLV